MLNMDKIFEQNGQIEEIVTKDTIKVTAKTVTPLLQLDETGKQRRMYVYENNVTGTVPFFSANGFRGILRRVAFKQQVEVAKSKDPDFEVSPELFYLYTSGAALDKTSAVIGNYINYKTENIVRKNSPVISLFGAGLSNIEGKIAVADLFPSTDMEKFREFEKKDGTVGMMSNLMHSNTFYRSDSAMIADYLYRNIIDMEDVKEWNRYYYGLVIIAKLKKEIAKAKGNRNKIEEILEKFKSKDENQSVKEQLNSITADVVLELVEKEKEFSGDKEKDSHIQQPVSLDFIVPGVKLTSSINAKYGYELSDVELGCLISSLAEMSLMQIGSAKRIGFGVLDWTIEKDGEVLFESKSDPDYVLQKSISVSENGKKYIQAWKDWLNENADKIDLVKIAEMTSVETKESLFD